MASMLTIPNLPRTTIPVDIDANADYPPSLSCPVVRGEVVEDDRVIIEKVTDGGRGALRLQFQSEVGGLFGPQNPYKALLSRMSADAITYAAIKAMADGFDQVHFYSTYAIYINDDGEVYARETPWSVTGTTQADDLPTRYNVGDAATLDRLVTMAFGAVACRGYVQDDPSLVQWVRYQVPILRAFSTQGKDLPVLGQVGGRMYEEHASAEECSISACGPGMGTQVGP